MRLFFVAIFLMGGALHAIVLFKNPTCSGVVVGSHAIFTLSKCIGPNTELVAPAKLKPIRMTLHEDKQVGLLFFGNPLPYQPIMLIGSRKFIDRIHVGQKITLGNTFQSSDDFIADVSETDIAASSGLTPELLGSPMQLLTEPTRSFHAIGIMTDAKTALRLDSYIDFISANVKQMISLPARSVTEKKPLVSLEAQSTNTEPAPQPQPQTAPAPESHQPSAPQSVGCACSQTRSSGGFLRRFLSF